MEILIWLGAAVLILAILIAAGFAAPKTPAGSSPARAATPTKPLNESFGSIMLSEGRVWRGNESQPVRGIEARVEETGQYTSRTTATRVVGGAIIGGPAGAIVGSNVKKKVDDRQLFLHVSGENHYWVEEIPAKQGAEARQFVARLLTAAKQA